jgi:hypothetical protein
MPEIPETTPQDRSEAWRRAVLEAAKWRENEERATAVSEQLGKLTPPSHGPADPGE